MIQICMDDKKPYPDLKDYRRHKRQTFSGKNIRLSENNLKRADLNGLVRLAKWLDVLPAKSNILFEKEWAQKVRCAVARKEKRLFGLPNQGREEKKMENRVELIKKLRALTNAPMGDCISALQESNNDLDKAVDWLKVKGLNSGGKVVDELKEGRIEVIQIGSTAVEMPGFTPLELKSYAMIQVSCQTDFAAKSELVQEYIKNVAYNLGASEPPPQTKELSYKLGETVKVKFIVQDEQHEGSGQTEIQSYIHSNGKIGVMIGLNLVVPDARLLEDAFYKSVKENLCMQIAATNTLSIFPEGLPTDVVVRQKAVFEKQVQLLKKPELVSEKILEGKMNGWYAEVCLMKQGCVWEPKLSIEKYLKKQEEICGHPIVVKKFVKFTI